jgi:4'-phosphopantetheinyl transferase
MRLPLQKGEVHVWRAELSVSPGRLKTLGAVLAPEEQSRADRFRFPRDRDRFVAGRGILRELLGRYLDQEPQAVRLATTTYGKPILALGPDGEAAPALQFNLSHADGLARPSRGGSPALRRAVLLGWGAGRSPLSAS